MSHQPERYPLEWPVGWPRTRQPQRSKFGLHGTGHSLYAARERLERELRLLGASGVLLSSNIPLRLDGLPYSNVREPMDHGIAVYFRIKGQPRVLACDKWDRVSDNMIALSKHVESIRGQIRWGVGSIEQAFGGYLALTAVGARRPWHVVLGVPDDATMEEIDRARLALLSKHHPDKGGAPGLAAEINAAVDEARLERRAV